MQTADGSHPQWPIRNPQCLGFEMSCNTLTKKISEIVTVASAVCDAGGTVRPKDRSVKGLSSTKNGPAELPVLC